MRSMVNNSRVSSVIRNQNFPKTVNIELTVQKPKLSFLKKYSDAAVKKQGTFTDKKNTTAKIAIPKLKIDNLHTNRQSVALEKIPELNYGNANFYQNQTQRAKKEIQTQRQIQ